MSAKKESDVLITEKATPSFSSISYSFANFRDKFVFVCGGITKENVDTDASDPVFEITSDVHIYDVDADQWRQGPSLINPRRDHSSCVLDNKIYIVGGRDETGR